MKFQRHLWLKLAIVLIALFNCAHSQSVGTDCKGKTYYCVDNQQFQVCEDLPDGTSQTVDNKVYPCPPASFCDNAGKSECDSRAMSTPSTTVEASSTTTSPTSTTPTTEAPLTCTHPGRFPNTTDCHRYFTCTLTSTGLRQTNYTCLYGMAFNPVSQSCTLDQSSCYPSFTCPSAGRFADPMDAKSYFWCLRNGSGYSLYHMTCLFGQTFDPTKARCSGWIGVKQRGFVEQIGRMASPGRSGYNK